MAINQPQNPIRVRPRNGNGHNGNGHKGNGVNGNGTTHRSISPERLRQLGAWGTGRSAWSRMAPMAAVKERPMQEIFLKPYPWWKRTLDFTGALVAIVLLSPVMLLVALVIRSTSAGPAIFTQRRGGRGGKPFTLYKFRSMTTDAERHKQDLMRFNERTGPVFKMTHDPRVTRVGHFIRKTSLDELPQLFNVLKGNMSLVGPRPLPVDEDKGYDQWHWSRLDVMPGITCIWQVTSRDESDFDGWVRQDIEYIRDRSLWNDVKLLVKTIPAVILRRGAH